MVSAVGSSSVPSLVTPTVASTAAIEARIARDRKELSNCVNCESAKTKQGQADILALSNKISIAEARLKEIKTANPASRSADLKQTAAGGRAGISSTATGENAQSKTDESATPPNSSDSNTGRFVDVFA